MKVEKVSESEKSLERTRESFEQWRSSRKKKERIPEHLWKSAIDLSESHSTFKIAKELRLDFKELRRRIHDSSKEENTPPEFVELKVEPLLSSAKCLIEMRSPGGFEMKVEAESHPHSRLDELVGLFLKESR